MRSDVRTLCVHVALGLASRPQRCLPFGPRSSTLGIKCGEPESEDGHPAESCVPCVGVHGRRKKVLRAGPQSSNSRISAPLSCGPFLTSRFLCSVFKDKTIKLWKITERDKRPEGYNLKDEEGKLKDLSTVTSLQVRRGAREIPGGGKQPMLPSLDGEDWGDLKGL